MAQDGVKLARRCSGGAVFHDLINICFTFMAGKPAYDKTISTQIIIAGLAEVGIAGSDHPISDSNFARSLIFCSATLWGWGLLASWGMAWHVKRRTREQK